MTLHLVIGDETDPAPAARALLGLAAHQLERGGACRVYSASKEPGAFAEPLGNLAFAEDAGDVLIWRYTGEAPDIHLAERFPGIRALLCDSRGLDARAARQLASLTRGFERVWAADAGVQSTLGRLGFEAAEPWTLGETSPPAARDALLAGLAHAPPLARTAGPAKVSVVICTLNRAAHLESCLLRLRRQRYPRFEVIVVNGPSADGTEAVLRKFAGEIKIRRNPRANLCVSRNLGIAAAAGEIVAFLDDDSFAHADWMREALPAFDDRLTVAAGGLSYRFRDEALEFSNGVLTEAAYPWPIQPRPGSHHDGRDGLWNTATGNNCLFRRDALLAAGGFDERIPYTHDESNVVLKMARRGMRTRHRPLAIVHHGSQPSLNRRDEFDLNWKVMVRDSIYCGYRNRPGGASPLPFLFRALLEHARHRLRDPIDWWLYRRVSLGGFLRIEWQCTYGLAAGVLKALFVKPRPLSKALLEEGREPFLPFPHEAKDPAAGIALFEEDEGHAERLAAAGYSVHVLLKGKAALLDSRRGVFRHSIPWADDAERAIACWRKLHELAVRADVRVLACASTNRGALLASLDPRFRVVTPDGNALSGPAAPAGEIRDAAGELEEPHQLIASVTAGAMRAARTVARWRDPAHEHRFWSLAAGDGQFAEGALAAPMEAGYFRLDLFAGLTETPRERDPVCKVEIRSGDGVTLHEALFDGSYFGNTRWAILSTAFHLGEPQTGLTFRITNPGFTKLLARCAELRRVGAPPREPGRSG